jgi:hypothetical protein
VIDTFNIYSRWLTHRSLTDTGGGYNLEGAGFPHTTLRPSQPMVLPFPSKGQGVCTKGQQVNQYSTSFLYYFIPIFTNFLSRSSSLCYFVERSIWVDLMRQGSQFCMNKPAREGEGKNGLDLVKRYCFLIKPIFFQTGLNLQRFKRCLPKLENFQIKYGC